MLRCMGKDAPAALFVMVENQNQGQCPTGEEAGIATECNTVQKEVNLDLQAHQKKKKKKSSTI